MDHELNVKSFSKHKRFNNTSFPNKRLRRSNEVSSEENTKHENETLNAKIEYFDKISSTLKDIPEENRELFAINALEESVSHEVDLSCVSKSSHCIETLLPICKDINVWKRFMVAFSKSKREVCTNASGSHITELLLYYSVQNIKNWSSVTEQEENKQKEFVCFCISWINEFGEFLCEKFIHFLENPYASHVAASIVNALGGQMTKTSDFRSKRAVRHKKESSGAYAADKPQEFALEQVTLETLPEGFKKKLKQLSRTVRQIKPISGYVNQSFCSTVFEALALALGKRLPKQFGKLVTECSNELFSDKNDEGVPYAILKGSCLYFVEKLFEASPDNLQLLLWNEHISPHAEVLAVHEFNQFFLQRLFEKVKEKAVLLSMIEKLIECFDKILEAETHGVFLSIASACVQHNAHQALFMKSLMQCLDCLEPEERHIQLISLILCFKKYDNFNSEINVCLKGSVLIQTLLSFQKPIKLVKSLLSLKPKTVLYLACHHQGCYVLTAFLKSSSVGEKNKDHFVNSIQPILLEMACEREGALTLSRMWTLFSLKQKTVVAQNLVSCERELKTFKPGNVVYNKFQLFQFKHRNDVWKNMQKNFVGKT